MNARIILASFLGMIVAWIVPIGGLAICQLATDGYTTDGGASAFWTGSVALVAWAGCILPFMLRFGRRPLFAAPRYAWGGWSLLGMALYVLLVVSWTGPTTLVVIWYPALVGAIAGEIYALIVRPRLRQDPSTRG